MAVGTLLNFDQSRGFGFVAVDDGEEDVFLHASVFHGDLTTLIPGTRVDFQAVNSERGRKALVARPVAEGVAASVGQAVPSGPESHVADRDQMCDVLSQAEFGKELTELLLNKVPSLTGQQICQIRQNVLAFASVKGWVDE
jgi:CspA family cold shock protein